MKKMNNLLVGLAFVIGASVGLPLYFYIANTLFYKGNDAKTVISLYIRNSVKIEVAVPHNDPFSVKNTLFTFKDTSYKSTLNSNGRGRLFTATLYSIKYKKFFITKLFDYSGTMFLPDQLDEKDIIITVNKEDFNSPYFGSKANPVPVFQFRGVKPLTFGGQLYDITAEEYKHNVTQYLQYMMPKEEFKKRFGK